MELQGIDVGGRIREARESKRLSRRELAEQVGCSPRAIQMWELGHRFPRPLALQAIADATGKRLKWFYEPVKEDK